MQIIINVYAVNDNKMTINAYAKRNEYGGIINNNTQSTMRRFYIKHTSQQLLPSTVHIDNIAHIDYLHTSASI